MIFINIAPLLMTFGTLCQSTQLPPMNYFTRNVVEGILSEAFSKAKESESSACQSNSIEGDEFFSLIENIPFEGVYAKVWHRVIGGRCQLEFLSVHLKNGTTQCQDGCIVLKDALIGARFIVTNTLKSSNQSMTYVYALSGVDLMVTRPGKAISGVCQNERICRETKDEFEAVFRDFAIRDASNVLKQILESAASSNVQGPIPNAVCRLSHVETKVKAVDFCDPTFGSTSGHLKAKNYSSHVRVPFDVALNGQIIPANESLEACSGSTENPTPPGTELLMGKWGSGGTLNQLILGN